MHGKLLLSTKQLFGGVQAGQGSVQGPAIATAGALPTVQLTLDDVVKLTLDRNLNIAVQRLNPQILDFTLAGIRTAYEPTFASLLTTQSVLNPPLNSLVGVPGGASGVTVGQQTFNAGITQNVPWGGGAFALTVNNARNTTTSTTAFYSPYYQPVYTAQYLQPLLRGRAIDANRQNLVVVRNNQNISETQLKATMINTLSGVRESYWNYVYTIQAVEVAQESLTRAQQLVGDNQARLDVGTMSQLDIITAQSQAAQAQQALVQAQSNRRLAEIALKQFIVAGTQDPNWSAEIVPVDRLEFHEQAIDVNAALQRAIGDRTDIDTAKLVQSSNNNTLKFLKNQLMPQADLLTRYGLSGIGGNQFVRQTDGSTLMVPGGFGDSLSSLFGSKFPQWSVQLNITQPIGRNVASAAVAQAKVQLEQADAQVRQIELQIATDVTNTATNVQNAAEAVKAADAAQTLAQKTYEAEVAKFDVGLSTNYNVILALNTVNAVKNSYLQAVLSYTNALVEFDRLQQTTLQNLNVTLLTGGTLGSPGPVGSAR